MTVRWVLLRGLTREAAHWGSFGPELAAATGGAVAAIDLPGSGARRGETAPWHVAALAQHCRQALPPHDGPTVLLALSLGAMVAIEWCRQAPGQVAGCVLVNTSAGGHSPFWRRLRPVHYPTVVRMLAGMDTAMREQRILSITSARPQQHAQEVARWIAIARSRPVSAGTAWRQLWAAARYRAPASPPPVPLLVLASAGDRLVDPACSRGLARGWQVPLREHPWAGHDLPLDDPQWVIEQVAQWWGAQGRHAPR
ncbi:MULTISPECIES: alpha/beta fold hydrolase [Ramlibacter]|uniref:alpha/beta fold hydrolase n=1 Tax=Ramlibacter TaxID=174951 RepID=UPI00308453C0